jgi:DNA-directed RNA polymerase subunit N (RpoN/RPB10)
MVVHILCPECSEDIGEIYPFFEVIKNRKCDEIISSQKNLINVDKIDIKADILKNFDFILKAIGINNHCCRIHIISTCDFDNIYW